MWGACGKFAGGWGMMNGGGYAMMFVGWLTYAMFIILIGLAIAALWKYLSKKK